MDLYAWAVYFKHTRVLKKCPLKELASSFFGFRRILICQRCLIPYRTKSCGVSDPTKQNPAVYQTLQNAVLWGIRPRRTMAELCTFYGRCLFCRVWYPAEQSLARYQTVGNNFWIQLSLWIWNRIQKYFRVFIWCLYRVDRWKKTEVENPVPLSL